MQKFPRVRNGFLQCKAHNMEMKKKEEERLGDRKTSLLPLPKNTMP